MESTPQAGDGNGCAPKADDLLLAPARAALERGDYARCLELLQPLAQAHAAATAFGGRIRLLMATAQMGQGNSSAAAASCRALRACRDAGLRAQARDLQEVLEAPALERPREWSMTLPSFAEMQPLEGQFKAMVRRRRRQPDPPPPPPTGPTAAPWGFALVVIALLAITLLLGGCVQLDTTVQFPAPGRLQLQQTSRSATGQPLPWQQQLASALRSTPWSIRQNHGELLLQAPVLPAPDALALLRTTLRSAADLAALPLPEPQLELRERNWLLGVRQQVHLSLDLRAVQALPGLQLTLQFEPASLRSVRHAMPQSVQQLPASRRQRERLRWPLQPGAVNELDLACWRWSKLGLGALLIAALLALSAGLQRLRLAAGFGLPQLPA